MSEERKTPSDLRYSPTHEWVRLEGKRATVGITHHAQSELTDVVFVDLPAVGKEGKARQPLMVLESVKTVADVYSPFDGKVVEVNPELKNHPELVNKDPYGKGWLYRLEVSGPTEGTGLLSASEYKALVAKGSGH